MRYQKTNQRRAVILMVVLSLLALFALVGVSFVLYADAEAAAARVARESQTQQAADVNPKEALAFFLGQLIYDVPDTPAGAASGLRGHSLARSMYGFNYTVPVPLPGLNQMPYSGVGRLHYACPSVTYPATGLTNVPAAWGAQLDDYAMVNYTWFSKDGFVRDPERVGVRTNAQLQSFAQTNAYVAGNAPYTYPDLNSFFLAAVRADGTVLTPSYHRPWLFQVVGGKPYLFNDMTNPNWTNQQGKYLTLRPRPAEHPLFPLPGDATGDVKNLSWAPGGNDSIWIDLGAPIMTAPDGTLYKMMFAPLIMDLDGRVNLNTSGNIQASIAALTASSGAAGATAWQLASGAHVSNQGWGPWEVNLSKVLYGDQLLYPQVMPPFLPPPFPQTSPPTPPEWMRLFTGMSYATTTPPNTLPIIAQAGAVPPAVLPPGLSSWMLPGIPGRYLESVPGGVWTPTLATPPICVAPWYPSALGLNTTLSHPYAMSDTNGYNETGGISPSPRPALQIAGTPSAGTLYPTFASGYNNGNPVLGPTNEATNHPLLYNVFQNPLNNTYFTRAFRASDMSALLRPNASVSGPVDASASAATSDLLRMCPLNFPSDATLATLPAAIKTLALRYRNLVTTQSWDIGAPGVTPYWWNFGNPASTSYLSANPLNYTLAPYGAPPSGAAGVGFPAAPVTVSNPPNTNPITSEFAPDGSAVSASLFQYLPTSYVSPPVPPVPPNPATYTTPGARIRLNRALPPYPHMGALLMPPYNLLPPGSPSPYGVAYNLTNAVINNQYLAAQQARQALANDLYRRLVAIAGLLPIPLSPAGVVPPPSGTSANPNLSQLAPRRWLAQLAVNIVDYIDEDDIMTPFNFYTMQDNPNAAGVPQPLAPPAPVVASQPTTQGPDDPTNTGANPDFWVFGTELPKVVLNEVVAEAQQLNTANAAIGGESVKLWLELFNTMPAVGGVNTQTQDQNRVPLYITNPAGGGYSPYRISISQYTMDQSSPPATIPEPPFSAQLPDASANVLGKAYIAPPFPQSTTDVDFSTPASVKMGSAGGAYPAGIGTSNVGVDAGNYFLIGPSSNLGSYEDPFSANIAATVPILRADNVTYTPTWTGGNLNDERSKGLTVMLRRLANPYLPLQTNPTAPNYNPYVTVDYIKSVPIQQSNNNIVAFGKTQPFAGFLQLAGNITYNASGAATIPLVAGSPVCQQVANATPPPAGAVTTNGVTNTFGFANYPLPPSQHYDWLVHLDRPPISPMELLHVSAWPPYKLTQKFMFGSDLTPTIALPDGNNIVTTFGHYAPWLDLPPGGNASLPLMAAPWWYDSTEYLPATNSHRLYRLFEFLECGDRAFGVNGLGRIPGKVNINTIWDSEILQALIDANLSMGISPNPSNNPGNTADPVFQVFSNMMASRSPSYYNGGAYNNPIPIGPVNMGLPGINDRPFMPLSTGFNLPVPLNTPSQFPNGFSVTTDTILRTNNAFAKAPTYPTPGAAGNNLYMLFQNYYDNGTPVPGPTTPGSPPVTSLVHPYMQTQMLTKLYNNVTTRSNTFAVFLTVGFFQVTDATTTPPTLGPEMGRSEGKQTRHRMFAVVDRTNLATFTTTGQVVPPAAVVTGPTPNQPYPAAPLNFTGVQTVQLPVLPPPLTIIVNPANPTQLLVPNVTTGMPGVIQPGTQLVIDAGTPFEETVTVIAFTPPGATAATITANFTLTHGVGGLPFTITQRGNPGPWLLIPYDPRLDPSVVPHFSIID